MCQVVQHVDEDDVGYARVLDGKLMGVRDCIEPECWNKVERQTTRKEFLEVARAATQLDRTTRNEPLDDISKKVDIDAPEHRFGLPDETLLVARVYVGRTGIAPR